MSGPVAAEPLVALSAVRFSYPDGRTVLDGADLALAAGERLCLVGPNGAGKSTLLKVIVGLVKPQAGRVAAFGRERRTEADFREVRALAGLVFQDPDDQLFSPTVEEDLAFGPLNLGRGRREAAAIVERVLSDLGLAHLRQRVTHRLSGGEKRLVALGTVLAMEPRVLLLDEPTNGLDDENADRLAAILERLPQAMILVSHDEAFRAGLGTAAVRLAAGRLERLPWREGAATLR